MNFEQRNLAFSVELTIRSVKHEIIPMIPPIRQWNHPRRELESSSGLGHLPRSEALFKRRRLEIVASIIAGKGVVSHHILAFSVHPDVRQVAEKRNHLFILAKKGEVFLCDVGPAALRRIQNVPGLELWELGEEFVEVCQRCDDLFSVVR